MTSIGLLLGVSSAKLGTMDMSVTRLLGIHIPALLPPTSTELDVPHNVQVRLNVFFIFKHTYIYLKNNLYSIYTFSFFLIIIIFLSTLSCRLLL